MCGIAGYYNWSERNVDDSSAIIGMLQLQKHRGPDDSGIRAFSLLTGVSSEVDVTHAEAIADLGCEGVIGFNRLSILDLSENGHQPMCSDDGQVILAFNGEIYNAFDFKAGLVAEGFRFRSTTDTEIVLYMYIKYGFDGMVRRLNGMFALAVIDLRKGTIYLARDRFGIKPMFLYQNGSFFAFSSEVKSFFAFPDFHAELETQRLDEYLLFRSVLNQSLLKHITPLEPGCYTVFSPANGFKTVTYFDVEQYNRQVSDSISMQASLLMFNERLRGGVERQLMSDVKLGCQLSGGIDSTLVTLAAKQIKQDDLLESVSIIFKEKQFSEEAYIDQVAIHSGIVAHKFTLESDYYLSAFKRSTWHFEAPLNHPNTIGIYLLSQRAKDLVTVLLSGEGADEVFGGYERFASLSSPYSLHTVLSGFKKHRKTPFRFFANYTDPSRRAVMASAFLNYETASMLRSDFSLQRAAESRQSCYRELTGSLFDRQVKYEMKTYLPDLLSRQDTMSMAHSIENRVPFLDNDLVDYSFSVPEKHLIARRGSIRETKYLLKKSAATVFGDTFAFRRKMGFGIPLRSFFSDVLFREWFNDEIFPGLRTRGLFDSRHVEYWMKNLSHISSHEIEALWVALSFEVWIKQFRVQ